MITTFHCGKLPKPDALRAQAIIEQFGGVSESSPAKRGAYLVIGYFAAGLTYQQRVGIQSTMTNEGIFAQ